MPKLDQNTHICPSFHCLPKCHFFRSDITSSATFNISMMISHLNVTMPSKLVLLKNCGSNNSITGRETKNGWVSGGPWAFSPFPISKWLLSINETIAVFVDIFEDLKAKRKAVRSQREQQNQLCTKIPHQAKIKVE